MSPDFEQGRRYERSELLELLREIRKIPDSYRLRFILANLELELSDSLALVVEETYVVTD